MDVDGFLARFDEAWVTQLVKRTGDTEEKRRTRIAAALTDALGELEGYIPRLPTALRPSAATLDVHQLKVAVYLLSLDRPGKEFEQMRNAYTDVIAFYKDAIAAAQASAASGGTSPIAADACAPPAIFNDSSLKGFP